mgnify:CR=1 FL=1
MKIIITLFVLLFSSSLFADNISDFEIDGMSIGDSLLKHYSEKQINNAKKTNYPTSTKFIDVWLNSKNELYEELSITIKENDKNYIIYSISGVINFINNFDRCLEFKKNVISELIILFPNVKQFDYEYIYEKVEDGKSIAYITDFDLSNGSVRVYCQDFSKITENKRGWLDDGRVEVSTREFLDWLNDHSY